MSALSTTRIATSLRCTVARVRTLALAVLVLALLAAPAAADTLSLGAGPDPARDSTPVTVHVSGQTSAAHPAVSVYEEGDACPADPGDATGPLVVSETVASGAFAADYRTTFSAGTVRLCAYLRGESGALLASATHTFFVRPLRIELALGLPGRVERFEPVRGDISYAGLPLTSDAGLWVDVKPDDGRGCAATRAAEPADARDLLTPAAGRHTFSTSFDAYGRNLVCVWLIRHDGSALAGPVSATVTVAHITGGRRFRGTTSQGLPVRFRRHGHTLYDLSLKVRCAGAVTTVRSAPIVLSKRGLFAFPSPLGTLRGTVGRRTAHGTLTACKARTLTWRASSAERS
jgi:hypothetical protein